MFKNNSFFNIKKILLFLILSSLIIFLNYQVVSYSIRKVFMYVAYPFQKISFRISDETRDIYSTLTSIANLKKQNAELIKENNYLLAQVASRDDQKKENKVLREQLRLAPRDKYDLETALVIGQDPRGLESWLIIDKGNRQGIKKGMPVIVAEGILVGKIEEVYINSSKVTLLTNPRSSINVVDLETGAKGVLVGEYSLGLAMNMVEQTEVLNVGDKIITSDLGGIFPRGLLVGSIQQSNSASDKLFQQAIIIPQVKYANLSVVSVIKQKK